MSSCEGWYPWGLWRCSGPDNARRGGRQRWPSTRWGREPCAAAPRSVGEGRSPCRWRTTTSSPSKSRGQDQRREWGRCWPPRGSTPTPPRSSLPLVHGTATMSHRKWPWMLTHPAACLQCTSSLLEAQVLKNVETKRCCLRSFSTAVPADVAGQPLVFGKHLYHQIPRRYNYVHLRLKHNFAIWCVSIKSLSKHSLLDTFITLKHLK